MATAAREPEYTVSRLRGGWAISVPNPAAASKRSRFALVATERGAADVEAARFWARYKLGAARTVGQIVRAWLDAHGHLAAATRNEDAWKAASGFWGGVLPTMVDEAACRAYALQRGRAPRTVRYELEVVSRALRWALKGDAPKLWFPAVPDPVARYLTKEEFGRFLAGCRMPHAILFATLAVSTGARKTALLELQWDQVDWENGAIELNRPGRVQSDKRRSVVPMNARLKAALEEARAGALSAFVIEYAGEPIGDIKKAIRLASERSGVRATPHMFRHSACVWMAQADVSLMEIAQFLGHANTKMVERVYGRFRPSFLRKAAAALDWAA